ncbi:EthD domain-containing protein [Mycena vitilis]|nr:EthD domain-containing protein [Mycena vitilis]
MTIRMISLLNRLPHVSFEEFDRHWGQVHGPLIEALPAVKSGLVKYKQFHVSPETNALLAAQGFPVMTYDGIVEWEAEKLEDILELFGSEELAKTIIPDEKNFFERSSVQVVAGDWK